MRIQGGKNYKSSLVREEYLVFGKVQGEKGT